MTCKHKDKCPFYETEEKEWHPHPCHYYIWTGSVDAYSTTTDHGSVGVIKWKGDTSDGNTE